MSLIRLTTSPIFWAAWAKSFHGHVGAPALLDRLVRGRRGARHLAADFGDRGRQLLGRRRHRLHVIAGLFGRRGDDTRLVAGLLGGRRHRLGARLHLGRGGGHAVHHALDALFQVIGHLQGRPAAFLVQTAFLLALAFGLAGIRLAPGLFSQLLLLDLLRLEPAHLQRARLEGLECLGHLADLVVVAHRHRGRGIAVGQTVERAHHFSERGRDAAPRHPPRDAEAADHRRQRQDRHQHERRKFVASATLVIAALNFSMLASAVTAFLWMSFASLSSLRASALASSICLDSIPGRPTSRPARSGHSWP